MGLENYVEECIKELNEKCKDPMWKQYATSPQNCRDLFAQRKPCVSIYKFIYNQLCEKKVEFGKIRSIVGQIVATAGFTVDEIVNQIKEFLKENSCKG